MLAIISRKIDLPGGIVGGIVTSLLFASSNFLGILLIATFFVTGTLASLYKIRHKTELALAEANHSRRGWKNVLSNSGAAAVVALLNILFPTLIQAEFLIAVCFAVALSDTLSSEMGNVTGRYYFNILSFQSGKRGDDGVVSWEGFGWGLVGSSIISTIYWGFFPSISNVVTIVFIGFFGNIVDSILGATLQQKEYLSNHGVNFTSTAVATVAAWVISF
ncbi:DUF92 domain-containing protein [Tunicatimonas pelagia]|uniref:DUF92 domain-containing protein n=1 Tax=Tunicatimonas pelagia TaxID=931531 RepID=UPI0026664501|nr:DUF92 domain-containing protein [Tunicatimonas pelagia]WKN43237.1 DUF92 domain-containing protein [Tunicatimonas pelagia]